MTTRELHLSSQHYLNVSIITLHAEHIKMVYFHIVYLNSCLLLERLSVQILFCEAKCVEIREPL